jgi:hypothetical protein
MTATPQDNDGIDCGVSLSDIKPKAKNALPFGIFRPDIVVDTSGYG